MIPKHSHCLAHRLLSSPTPCRIAHNHLGLGPHNPPAPHFKNRGPDNGVCSLTCTVMIWHIWGCRAEPVGPCWRGVVARWFGLPGRPSPNKQAFGGGNGVPRDALTMLVYETSQWGFPPREGNPPVFLHPSLSPYHEQTTTSTSRHHLVFAVALILGHARDAKGMGLRSRPNRILRD